MPVLRGKGQGQLGDCSGSSGEFADRMRRSPRKGDARRLYWVSSQPSVHINQLAELDSHGFLALLGRQRWPGFRRVMFGGRRAHFHSSETKSGDWNVVEGKETARSARSSLDRLGSAQVAFAQGSVDVLI